MDKWFVYGFMLSQMIIFFLAAVISTYIENKRIEKKSKG